jgi:hypothetical protein
MPFRTWVCRPVDALGQIVLPIMCIGLHSAAAASSVENLITPAWSVFSGSGRRWLASCISRFACNNEAHRGENWRTGWEIGICFLR